LVGNADDLSKAPRPRDPSEPFIQIVPNELWIAESSNIKKIDDTFAAAEEEHPTTSWLEAHSDLDDGYRVILPNESSHVPRLMLLTAVEFEIVGPEGEPVSEEGLEYVSTDVEPDFELKKVAAMFNDRSLPRLLRPFRRKTCVDPRLLSDPCRARGCTGRCERYRVSDGAVERFLCTCVKV
jgi:hypothetical protein